MPWRFFSMFISSLKSKAMVFLVVMHGRESWIMKKAECWSIDAFELWCQRRFLRVPWNARRLNQSILKEIHPEYSLEGLMQSWNSKTLATWCEEVTHWKKPWCWERLRAGREGGWQRMKWLDDITNSKDMCLSKLWETWKRGKPGVLPFMGIKESETSYQLNNNWCHRPGQIPATSLLGVALNLGPHSLLCSVYDSPGQPE